MSKMTHKVLTGRGDYGPLLDATRWDEDQNPVTRDWKQRSMPRLMPDINKLIQAHEGTFHVHMFGTLSIRVFEPYRDFHPEEVCKLSQDLAVTFDGVWTPECEKAMSEIARIYHYGLASIRLVTTVGVNFIVDGFQGTQNISTLRFHGVGTGTNSEATGDTALQTELTTQLTPASTRATGTLTEGASANIFRTVGSNVVNSSVTATEHGVFNQAATGGGTLLDRSVFAGVGLVNGNTFQTTYDLTLAAGG